MAKAHIQMTAQKREGSGKGTARALRRINKIPAVIYGDHKAPVLLSIDQNPVMTEYHRGHFFTSLCDLTVDGDKHLVITRDVQKDPVSDYVIHVDFLRVTEKTIVNVEVPVHFIGHENSPALKEGATLTVVNHEIPLMCPANAIPEEITIDISGHPMGHSFKLADIQLPAGIKADVQDLELFTIATLAAPRKEEEVPAEAPVAGEVPASEQAEPGAEGAEGEAKPAAGSKPAEGKKEEKK
jgi:large subunit ribosomal protein L25